MHERIVPYHFPWATFTVNLLGSFLIGLFYALSERFHLPFEFRLFLTTGLCGGFTTFSTFSSDGVGPVSYTHLKAVILGRENGRERSLAIIYHELSHHFVSQILGKRPPSWLNEGLSEYFEHCTIHKKAVRHTFTEYEQGRVRTMYMLGEVNLPTFLNSSQGKFMKQQMTDEQYSYILSHALVTFWIESVPREIFKKFISVLQNKNDPSTVSEQINLVYPGGFQQFEKDFEAAYK